VVKVICKDAWYKAFIRGAKRTTDEVLTDLLVELVLILPRMLIGLIEGIGRHL
jgi:hypothetical protein